MSDSPKVQARVVPWLYGMLLPIHRFLLGFYFQQIRVEGREYLPETGAFVLAPKHYSRWDPLVLALLSREPFYFMAKADQCEGFQGWFSQRLGAFPVDLERPAISSLKTAIALLASGQKLVLFPEGGIVRDELLRSLQPGLARLVLQAESLCNQTIPIVPIAIRYEPDAIKGAIVCLQICPPLHSGDYRQSTDKRTAAALTLALENVLREKLHQLQQQ
ncbi:lysophospholipid acyltransferase family protein [Oscillatoria sp. FACHB-1406]|uniref:lysophospholipid acyltransferase family protein n=1 Tax=Oscillatoria sp. FACHB-1406 TaxID=2692846 RepID=UPI0016839E4D|nr:lysophospholipid acyltransferase family protein [Oscillatoria sp. FACHB-1406]MBD2576882.1 1-acyl-sn-glycerol-3-phosphate acyltransferase [Oscillatoria sp. FACHB-1406]